MSFALNFNPFDFEFDEHNKENINPFSLIPTPIFTTPTKLKTKKKYPFAHRMPRSTSLATTSPFASSSINNMKGKEASSSRKRTPLGLSRNSSWSSVSSNEGESGSSSFYWGSTSGEWDTSDERARELTLLPLADISEAYLSSSQSSSGGESDDMELVSDDESPMSSPSHVGHKRVSSFVVFRKKSRV
jgi:hypothetical protein